MAGNLNTHNNKHSYITFRTYGHYEILTISTNITQLALYAYFQ